MQNFDEVAQEAQLLGITVVVSSGDNGSSDGVADGHNHVEFPASCPHVLATGGTRLLAANGNITNETVWNDGAQGGATGGGYSTYFACPDWQANAASEFGRGVPDVAANADPDTGYEILVDGQQMVVGGTSAAAPLWAGLIALLNQKLQTRLGFINTALYNTETSSCFRDITTGNNGAYNATTGWDPATGLGTPVGVGLVHGVQGVAAHAQAGTTQGRATTTTTGNRETRSSRPSGSR
jgi:kumamolisin